MRSGQLVFVPVRLGRVVSGGVIVADSSTEGLCSPCCSLWRVDEVWLGNARSGQHGFGRASYGTAIAADGSKEGASLPCCSLWEGG
jgi:hypothetical protein